MIAFLLICAGVLGALLDILLYVLQLHDLPMFRYLQNHTSAITLLSVGLIGLSLLVQFNAGTLVMVAFIAFLAITSPNSNKKDKPPEAIYSDPVEGSSIPPPFTLFSASQVCYPPANLQIWP